MVATYNFGSVYLTFDPFPAGGTKNDYALALLLGREGI